MEPLSILIFGAGALGQAMGCMLACAGHSVDMVLRPRFIEPIAADGISVDGIFGTFHAGSVGVYPSIEPVRGASYDYAFITTKSYDTAVAAEALSTLDTQAFRVVSFQNGCGNVETVADCFGGERTLGGRVITGFEIYSPGHVRITVTADDVHIGGLEEGVIPPAAERLAEALHVAGLPSRATAFIGRDLLAKLLYNCALNPLGALLGVHYGALGEDDGIRRCMNGIVYEVFTVIGAMGERTHWNDPDAYLLDFYERQLPATYHHRPSMLQDLQNGKRTEIDALTGYVAGKGREHGIATPLCDMATALVRFRERQGRP